MNSELSSFDIRRSTIARLGKRMIYLGSLFGQIYGDICGDERGKSPNPYTASLFLREIRKETRNILRHQRYEGFDGLVQQNYMDTISAWEGFTNLFFRGDYDGKKLSIKDYLNEIYLPPDLWHLPSATRPKWDGAMGLLFDMAGRIDYKASHQFKQDLGERQEYVLEVDDPKSRRFLQQRIPELRTYLDDYLQNIGLISSDQRKPLERYHSEKRIADRIGKLEWSLEINYEDMPQELKRMLLLPSQAPNPESMLDDSTRGWAFDYQLSPMFDCFAWWHSPTMSMRSDPYRFFLHKDPRAGDIKIIKGVAQIISFHENAHRLQTVMSELMPEGLQWNAGMWDLSALVTAEGVAMYCESFAERYLSERMEQHGLTANDMDLMRGYRAIYLEKKILSNLYSALSRVENVEIIDHHFAEREMVAALRVPVLRDHFYLYNTSIDEAMYDFNYLFGSIHCGNTMNEFTRRLQLLGTSQEEAAEWTYANSGVIIQGLTTGRWSWNTHGPFFLDFFVPKAIKSGALEMPHNGNSKYLEIAESSTHNYWWDVCGGGVQTI